MLPPDFSRLLSEAAGDLRILLRYRQDISINVASAIRCDHPFELRLVIRRRSMTTVANHERRLVHASFLLLRDHLAFGMGASRNAGIFNKGYFATRGEPLVRTALCAEAIRYQE